jgi:hypothetical protein
MQMFRDIVCLFQLRTVRMLRSVVFWESNGLQIAKLMKRTIGRLGGCNSSLEDHGDVTWYVLRLGPWMRAVRCQSKLDHTVKM